MEKKTSEKIITKVYFNSFI
jgi:hypothetical protein